MRKFVTQLVRRLPKNFADAVPEAAERLEVEQTQVAILLPREPVVALLVAVTGAPASASPSLSPSSSSAAAASASASSA